MRKRSIRVSYFFVGIFLLGASLIIFTRIIVPIEQLLIDMLGRVLLGVGYAIENVERRPHNQPPGEVRVVGRHADQFSDVFLVDGRALSGSRVLRDHVLIGFVVETGERFSKVQALSSPVSKITGVFERTGIITELQGKGAGLLEARVPRGSDVAIGDQIIENTGDIFIIGSITKIIDVPSDPLLGIVVSQPVNLQTLMFVALYGS